MNKTATIVGGIVIIVLVAGLIIYSNDHPTTTSTATSTSTTTGSTGTNTTVIPQPGLPVVIINTDVVTTDTTANVNGSINPKSLATNYWYEYGMTSSLGSKTATQSVGSGFTVISAPAYITGLSKNTTYFFRLVAENQYGRANTAEASFKTTVGNSAPIGSAPTAKTLSASSITRTTANVNGQVTPNKSSTQYWFEYGKTADLGNTSNFSSAGSGSVVVPASASLSNLDPRTIYYFRINAQNQFGTVNGVVLSFKTLGPAVPSEPTAVTGNAVAISTSSADLKGTVNPNGLDTKYWFEYSTDSLLGSLLTNTTAQTSIGSGVNEISIEKSVSGLHSKTNYYFRLVAQNSAGTVFGEKMTFKTR